MNRAIAARGLTAPLLAAVALAGCASASPLAAPSERDIVQRVAEARAPEEHLSLAAYFEAQATAAQDEADRCRALRRYYERKPQTLYYPTGMAPAMLNHYDALIENHQRNAEEYRALAQLHRKLAQGPAGAGSNN